MGTWYSNRLFTVGDTIYFTKYWQNSYNTAAAGVYSGKYSFYATVSECIATGNNRVHNIKFTGLHNTVGTITGGGGYCTPSEVTSGYQNWITYNGNGGTVSSAHQTGYVGKALTGTASRTGYTFAGWYSAASGGSKYTTIPNSDGYTFYAHWTANKYTVTLNNQSATTAGTTSVSATYDSAMPAITVPTKTGYRFQGYYANTGGSGTKYYTASGSSNNKWNQAAAKTLYAYWLANTYTVHFDGNGATGGSVSDQSYTYGASGPLNQNNFTKGISWGFNGWNTKANGSGTSYADKQSVSNLTSTHGGTVTLYAQWKQLYLPPTIGKPTSLRYEYDSSTQTYVPSDTGTCAHVEFNWAVDLNVYDDNYATDVLVEYKKRSDPDTAYATLFHREYDETDMMQSDTFIDTNGTIVLSTDYTYDIRISISDRYGPEMGIPSPQATQTDFISLAYFIIDFSPSGSIGIGAPATDSTPPNIRFGTDIILQNGLTLSQYIGNIAYPVGSYYMSEDSTDPTTIFGGSWTQVKDRFILAKGDTYTSTTGGAASVEYTPGGTIAGTAINVSQMPSHGHTSIYYGSGGSFAWGYNYTSGSGKGVRSSSTAEATSGIGLTGGGQTHSHGWTGTKATIATIPPYRTAYVWRRTALAAASLSLRSSPLLTK